jgi:uncharacterized repeat protein (TIGR03806 family)
VVFSGEMGLLGLAFHPDYATNGYFYVNYVTGTTDQTRKTVISRFRVLPDNPRKADPQSEQVILEVAQPFANHNGGMIAFGPDGYLYIGMGDGGSGGDPYGNGQNPKTLLGDMLRIDVDHPSDGRNYGIPADNPYAGATDGSRPEIYAIGLRNPWRWSFDRVTGQLWAGDVGQDAWEEVDLIERGKNYGWNRMEGTHCYNPPSGCDQTGLTLPVIDYAHSVGRSITGGYVYRGSRLSELFGRYLYADFANGQVWALAWDGAKVTANTLLIDSDEVISSFGEDATGEVYLLGYYTGTVYRLERAAAPSTTPPFPTRLSDTGCFTDVAARIPAPGVYPYTVNAPLWADAASKDRWIALPGSSAIDFDPAEPWTFPDGTIAIKDFYLEEEVGNPLTERRLETRLLIKHGSSWSGYVYQWDDAQTDAYLLEGSLTGTYPVIEADGSAGEVTHYYPSRSDCQSCHTAAAGSLLGLRTGQLNRDFDYGEVTDNQLRTLDHLGLFSSPVPGPYEAYEAWPDPADETVELELRARSYLASNCAHCHLPGGLAVSTMDLRYDTPLSETQACGMPPLQGDLGVSGALLIDPGDAARSVVSLRMHATDGNRMPPVASSVVDPLGTAVIDQWIDALPGCP